MKNHGRGTAPKRPWTVVIPFADSGKAEQRIAVGGRKNALDSAVIQTLAERPDRKGLVTGCRVAAARVQG